MKRNFALLAAILALASAAEGQVSYCKDIGKGKTYCGDGTIVHRFGNTVVVPYAMPMQPHTSLPPNSLLQNNALPTMSVPYSPIGTQSESREQYYPYPIAPAQPATHGGTVLVMPPRGSRICHQFGTVLVCD